MNVIADLSHRYWDAFKSSLFQQSWLFIAATLFLESVHIDLFILVAIVGHWFLVLVIATRRPVKPTRADLIFCEFGYLPVVLLTFALSPIVWLVVGDTTLFERRFGRLMIANVESLLPLQVLAATWIVVFLALELFWRKAKVKDSRQTQQSSGKVERNPNKVKSKSPKSPA